MPDDVSRHVKALVIASASAPYLTSLFMGLPSLAEHGLSGIGDAFEYLAATLIVGTAGLVIYGLPIAIAAGGFGGVLIWIGFRHPAIAIMFGAALGALFGCVLQAGQERTGNGFWLIRISMILSGAICGFIYWRIAIRRTPEAGHAIAEP
ncbi:hypothetical protein [Microvirga sp. TS319]|uniref:hypothetical protein n=1 Tax=Microvirga sp. TS319 TaxID=3241165 RepID=UPI00351A7B3E